MSRRSSNPREEKIDTSSALDVPNMPTVRIGSDAPSSDVFADNIAFLLRRAQDTSFAAFSALASGNGLRPGHYSVLQLIAHNPGLSQKELSDLIGRDKATVTSVLQEFEKKGYVRRVVDPQDGRGRMVHLTPAGIGYLGELAACASVHDARLDALLGEDKDALVHALKDIITRL